MSYMEIINEAGISIDKKLDDGRDIIQIGNPSRNHSF